MKNIPQIFLVSNVEENKFHEIHKSVTFDGRTMIFNTIYKIKSNKSM